MKSIKIFGKHLTFDGYGVDKNLLASFEYVFRFLDEMPEKIKMKKLNILFNEKEVIKNY